MRSTGTLGGALALALLAAACAGERPAAPAPILRPTRGYILLSIDTLRADALGVYGSRRPTSPFLDRLAGRAVVFENAFAQIPSTLPSHMSMFTGLYPTEHGVGPGATLLAAEHRTLPELFRAAGFRTFGHSEGGWVSGDFGFARGFEEWTDTAIERDTDVERTLQRGLDSLARLADGERFFLFLHTYTTHDPYAPPPGYRGRFWPGPAPAGAFAPEGPRFLDHNSHFLDAPRELAAYYRALYDEGVRYLDDALARFFGELERRGLAADSTVVLTSDHGEEFLEHGRYVHTQAYPESLRVPLLIVHPDVVAPRRVAPLVETIDLLPTLAELAGFVAPEGLSGESLAALLAGGGPELGGRAQAQNLHSSVAERTLLVPVGGRLHQIHLALPELENDGFWVSRRIVFDASAAALDFRAVAFREPRTVEVLAGGEPVAALEIGTAWKSYRVELGRAAPRRVTLRTADCESPARLGVGPDLRCLSFKIDGIPLTRLELFDLGNDPGAQRDLAFERPDLLRTLALELKRYPETARYAAGQAAMSDEQVRQLRALGYLP